MKRLMILLTVLSIAAAGHAQTELSIAKTWLEQHGVPKGRLKLRVTDEREELAVCEDVTNKAFAIIVRNGYADTQSDRVLAYSVTNIFSNPEGSWTQNVLESYCLQLRMLASRFATDTRHTVSFPTVAPLLGRTCWGQSYPYNALCPYSPLANDNKLAGCVAVAMSQVMSYHRYPNTGRGQHSYTMNGQVMSEDFTSIHPAWTDMQPTYTQTRTSTPPPVATLMRANAIAVNSSFDATQTSSSALYARSALVNIWGYSPRCSYDYNVTPERMARLLRDELQALRPVILTGGGHAFVCDGSDGGFLHLNLGWSGAGNGYYRWEVCPDCWTTDSTLPAIANGIIHEIKPATAERWLSKSITLSKAGTLANAIAANERWRIRRLKVTGKLNGADMKLLRQMMGASGCDTRGVLSSLDLSDAEFITDKNTPYLRIEAEGCTYTIGKTVYDFNNMTPSLFQRFSRTFAASGKGYRFVTDGQKFYVDFHTEAKTIGCMMFADCQNLTDIKLPANTTKILGRAFLRCTSLPELTLPKSVKEIETGAMSQCYMLKRLILSSPNVTEVVYGLSPVKTAGRHGEVQNSKYRGILDSNDSTTCKGIYLLTGKTLARIKSLNHKEYIK